MAKKAPSYHEMIVGTTPVILHAPHGSTVIPDLALGSLTLNEKELKAEILAMTDHYTDRLSLEVCKKLGDTSPFAFINNVSRLAVDPERFNDATEEMEAAGMGAVYTKGSQGQDIRIAHDAIRERLINEYYAPYARAMGFFVKNALAIHKRVVIVDVHSYASIPLPYELHTDQDRPEICIGTDEYHTPATLLGKASSAFSNAGYEVGLNAPFAGTYVPLDFYQKEPSVMSIMVEIRRDMYMDETTGKIITEKYERLRTSLEDFCKSIAGFHLPI
jgi:N-formylglutamate amidohydrolase